MRRNVIALTVLLLSFLLVPHSEASEIGGNAARRWGPSDNKGFETCGAPSISTMRSWWEYSPYWNIGIYLGGSSRGCSQPNLNPSWARSVHDLGWSYYLTWVGPQAPCTSFSSRFSYNTSTAYSQGQAEADKALTAAVNLGFNGYSAHYYDLEAFNTGDSGCRAAAKSFVAGWVDRLAGYHGHLAGVYGSSCGSAASDWATLGRPPSMVWLADWNLDPDVWGLRCVPNGYWSGDQRIHQYRGGHWESYGGIGINIDNDCEKGQVTPHDPSYGGGDPACLYE